MGRILYNTGSGFIEIPQITANATPIADNLETEDALYALSAKQGKTLNESKANKATTLDGYGITDAYTKDEADELINANKLTDKSYTNDDLKSLTTSGEYLVADEYGRNYTLIVVDYPGYYCVQYKFNNNNLLRRYGVYEDGKDITEVDWTEWSSIARSNYDPTSDLPINSVAVKKALQDTCRYGQSLGNTLNKRYFTISNLDAAYMYNQLYQNRKNQDFFSKTYDFTTSILISDESVSNTYITSDGFASINTYNNGNTVNNSTIGVGLSASGNVSTFDLSKLENYNSSNKYVFVVKIMAFPNYSPRTITISFGDKTYTASVTDSTWQTLIIDTSKSSSTVSSFTIKSDGYALLKSINIIENLASTITLSLNGVSLTTIDITSGDSVSLYKVLTELLSDNVTINIHEGAYFLGDIVPDVTDYYSCCIDISNSNVTINGDGQDKTTISGVYLNNFGMRHSVIQNSGSNNVFKNFTVVAEYVPSINGQAPAVGDYGSNSVWYNCGIYSGQDTLYCAGNLSGSKDYSHFFINCTIAGTVDFVFGGSDLSFFHKCSLQVMGRSVADVICAPNTTLRGILFNKCTIGGTDDYEYTMSGNYALARPWGNNSKVYFVNTHYFIEPNSDNPYQSMGSNTFDESYGDISGTDITWKETREYHPGTLTTDILSNTLTTDEITLIQQYDETFSI